MRNLDVDVLFESASNFNSILKTVLILLGKKILGRVWQGSGSTKPTLELLLHQFAAPPWS
jgi:hypothetical protein